MNIFQLVIIALGILSGMLILLGKRIDVTKDINKKIRNAEHKKRKRKTKTSDNPYAKHFVWNGDNFIEK